MNVKRNKRMNVSGKLELSTAGFDMGLIQFSSVGVGFQKEPTHVYPIPPGNRS